MNLAYSALVLGRIRELCPYLDCAGHLQHSSQPRETEELLETPSELLPPDFGSGIPAACHGETNPY